ncbi:MAG TPA: bacterioferritin-associated ferredoxin [Gammaproteobacteria bacterium]|nr:bacterioferritin-associated ferredoxin [Gammaproteobacteria bacterium]
MYVCVCHAVTDREIRAAVDDGLCTLRELADTLGVATGCGKCARLARELIDARLREGASTEAAPGSAQQRHG